MNIWKQTAVHEHIAISTPLRLSKRPKISKLSRHQKNTETGSQWRTANWELTKKSQMDTGLLTVKKSCEKFGGAELLGWYRTKWNLKYDRKRSKKIQKTSAAHLQKAHPATLTDGRSGQTWFLNIKWTVRSIYQLVASTISTAILNWSLREWQDTSKNQETSLVHQKNPQQRATRIRVPQQRLHIKNV